MSNIHEAIAEAIEACQETANIDNDVFKLHNYNACSWLYDLLDEADKPIQLKVVDIPPDVHKIITINHLGNLFDKTWINYVNEDKTNKVLDLNTILEVIE